MLANNVGSCWHLLRGACKRTQQLPTFWRLSKEAMHSGTVILIKDCNAHAQTFSRGQHCCGSCKRAQHCYATLRRSQNNRNVGTCCAKVWPVSNYTQQVPTSLWFHANRRNILSPIMLRVVGQQFVCLHGTLPSDLSWWTFRDENLKDFRSGELFIQERLSFGPRLNVLLRIFKYLKIFWGLQPQMFLKYSSF